MTEDNFSRVRLFGCNWERCLRGSRYRIGGLLEPRFSDLPNVCEK
jgi:hypothetical protein